MSKLINEDKALFCNNIGNADVLKYRERFLAFMEHTQADKEDPEPETLRQKETRIFLERIESTSSERLPLLREFSNSVWPVRKK